MKELIEWQDLDLEFDLNFAKVWSLENTWSPKYCVFLRYFLGLDTRRPNTSRVASTKLSEILGLSASVFGQFGTTQKWFR